MGGSPRKQEGEIKRVFPQSERGNDHWENIFRTPCPCGKGFMRKIKEFGVDF